MCVRVAVEVRWSAAGWDGSPLTSIVVAVDALFVNNTASLMCCFDGELLNTIQVEMKE